MVANENLQDRKQEVIDWVQSITGGMVQVALDMADFRQEADGQQEVINGLENRVKALEEAIEGYLDHKRDDGVLP